MCGMSNKGVTLNLVIFLIKKINIKDKDVNFLVEESDIKDRWQYYSCKLNNIEDIGFDMNKGILWNINFSECLVISPKMRSPRLFL